MNRLRLLVSDTKMRMEKSALSVEKCVNFDEAEFVFDKTWDGMDKLAVFWRGDVVYQIPLIDSNVCLIPWELMVTKGTIQIGCIGTKPDGTVVTTKTPVTQSVVEGAYREGTAPKEPTPSLYAQLSGLVADYVAQVDEVYSAYRNGKFQGEKGDRGEKGERGEQGPQGPEGPAGSQGPAGPQGPKGEDGTMTFEDLTEEQKESLRGPQGKVGPQGPQGIQGKDGESGATFTPFVASDGTLSWTNDKGLTNPGKVNIKGPQGETGAKGDKGDTGATGAAGADGAKGDKGDTGARGLQGEKGADGYTPVKGKDYFTENDKTEIVDSTVETIRGVDLGYAKPKDVAEEIANHNKNTGAHTDIRASLDTVHGMASSAQAAANEAKNSLSQVENDVLLAKQKADQAAQAAEEAKAYADEKFEGVSDATNIAIAHINTHNEDENAHSGIRADVAQKLDKLDFEYWKTVEIGNLMHICVGKFGVHDSNLTVDISYASGDSRSGRLIIATQNYITQQAIVYGDARDLLTPNIYIKPSTANDAFVEVYIKAADYGKFVLHVYGVDIESHENICTAVQVVPSTATLRPTNALTENFAPKSHVNKTNNPHGVTAAQVGAPTFAQMNDAIAAASLGGGGGTGGGGGVSSWNDLQDIPDTLAYIEDGGTVEILPDYTINSDEDMMGIPRLGLVEGNTYTVQLQGTEYACVAWSINHPEAGAVIGLGDIYTGTEGMFGTAPTGEPFVLMEISPEVAAIMGVNVMIQPLVEMELPVVFSVYGKEVTIHKLDNRCLDLDWLPLINYQTAVPLGEYDNGAQVGGGTVLVPGAKVKVTYDGVPYDLTVYAYAENKDYFYVGNKNLFSATFEDTEEPFLFVNVTEAAVFVIMFADGNPHSIGLEVMAANKAPTDLLPYASENEDGIIKASDKVKLDSVEEGANYYKHPTYTWRSFGFYKFSVNGEGHVVSAEQVPDATFDATTKPGKMVAGETFTIGEEEVTAANGAEIFNLVNGVGNNIATGECAHAEGGYTNATGGRSHAEGYGTTASGLNSHAEGYFTEASNDSAHAEGIRTKATEKYTHAEGYESEATKLYAHAEGHGTTASGQASHAEGMDTIASGDDAHAEGYSTDASGKDAHAEGNNTTASSLAAHAEGLNTTASGQASHAEGADTIASGAYQHVQGYFNIEDTENKYLHIVGNGAGDDNRKNAHTLDRAGIAWFAGGIELTSPNGTRYRFTVSDDGTLTATAV